MTEIERIYLMHLLSWADISPEGARESAQHYAKIDSYQLKNLPDLLEQALKKRAEMKEVT